MTPGELCLGLATALVLAAMLLPRVRAWSRARQLRRNRAAIDRAYVEAVEMLEREDEWKGRE